MNIGIEEPSRAPEHPGVPALEGIDSLRTTAKWLIAAFAAVGAALLAGVQLTELGQARPVHTAAIGFGVAMAGVATAIFAASDVLRPRSLTPGQLPRSHTTQALRDAVRDDHSLLEGKAESLDDLVNALVEDRKNADTAWAAQDAELEDSPSRIAALRAEERLVAIQDLVDRLSEFGLYLATSRAFTRARVAIVAAAVACAAGAATFSYATSRPADRAVPTAPQLVTLRLNSDRSESLSSALGTQCDLRAVAAIQVAGSLREPEVVTLPQEGCTAQRFVLTDAVGVATRP